LHLAPGETLSTGCRMGTGVVESVYSGAVSPEELERAVVAAVDLARESGTWRFYTDVTGLTGGHSVGDLFAVVGLLERLGLPRTLREALLVLPTTVAGPDVQFYEDACRNRGWNVRLFTERERAFEWLNGP
jgi:hypothetical protein